MTGAWATEQDVLDLTGVSVGQAILLQAQAVIESFVDIDPASVAPLTAADAGYVSLRDREKLKRATAFQAAWMHGQIDVASRMDATNVQQDGLGSTGQHPDWLVLAPLAKRNIDNLSWNQSGMVGSTGSPRYADLAALEAAVLRDEVDLSDAPWMPYPAGGL